MDLMNIIPSSDDIVTTLRHPKTNEILKNDDGSEMTITRYSPFSKEYSIVADTQVDTAINLARSSEGKDITYSEGKALRSQLIVDTIKEWNITFGEKVKFSKKKATEILEDPRCFWIKDQLEEDEEKAKVFTKA